MPETLLAEQVPLRNLKAIAEVLADAGARSQDPVTLASAVSLATSVCPTSMIDLPALTNLDTNGTAPVNPCNGLMGLSFVFSQNVEGDAEAAPGQTGDRGASENAPGQNRNTETTPPSATPSTPPGQVGR